jgi:hypothetical protein
VDKGLWLECPRGFGYRGARESINTTSTDTTRTEDTDREDPR